LAYAVSLRFRARRLRAAVITARLDLKEAKALLGKLAS
jgi:hypothetical protein